MRTLASGEFIADTARAFGSSLNLVALIPFGYYVSIVRLGADLEDRFGGGSGTGMPKRALSVGVPTLIARH